MPTNAMCRFSVRTLACGLSLAAAIVVFRNSATAAEPAAPAEQPVEPGQKAAADDRHPDLVRLSPTDEVWIDRGRKQVVVGGKIALAEGPIEVFACPAGTKEHEAIVATKGAARLVHAGLLAVGLEPGKPVAFAPEYRAAQGPAVTIRMRWRDAEGRDRECDARDWIRDTRTGEPLKADWVFTGSDFWRDPDGTEHYQADGGDLVCVSNFPTAAIDLPIQSSQSNEALLFEARAGSVPPPGTPVEMVFAAKP